MLYKGVQFSVVATAEPDIWEWRYELDNIVKTGRTQTRLPLRTRKPSPPGPDSSAKSGVLTT